MATVNFIDLFTNLAHFQEPFTRLCESVHYTVGAGRGGGVQRDTTDGWLLGSPLFPLAVRPRRVAAHGRPLPVEKTRG